MLGLVFSGALEAPSGVTILAAKQTALIHADIFADDAATGLALMGIFLPPDLGLEGGREIFSIDAASGLDPVPR